MYLPARQGRSPTWVTQQRSCEAWPRWTSRLTRGFHPKEAESSVFYPTTNEVTPTCPCVFCGLSGRKVESGLVLVRWLPGSISLQCIAIHASCSVKSLPVSFVHCVGANFSH